MYIPKHWHFAISTAISLLGFYIMHSLRRVYSAVTEDVWLLFFVLQYISVVHVTWIYKAGLKYQAYITREDARRAPGEEPIYHQHTGKIVGVTQVKEPDGFTPLVRLKEQPVHNQQIVSLPRFDMERQFAKELLIMRDYKPNDEAVILTEKKWKRPNKFETRQAFVDTLEKWKYYKILGRESAAKNARHIVIDWRQVELIANGNPLPPLAR